MVKREEALVKWWMDGQTNERMNEIAGDGLHFILPNLQAQGGYNSLKIFWLQTNNCCLATPTIELEKRDDQMQGSFTV